MGNGALAIGPKLPRPSSTLPLRQFAALQRRDFLHPAGVGEHGRAISLDMLVDPNAGAGLA